MNELLSEYVNLGIELFICLFLFLILPVLNGLFLKHDIVIFLQKYLLFLFKSRYFVLVFADAFKELAIVSLPFDKSLDELVGSFHCRILFYFSESSLRFIEFCHLSLHF